MINLIKTLSIIFSLAFLLLLSACGEDSGQKESSPSSPASPSRPSQPIEPGPGQPDSGQSGDESLYLSSNEQTDLNMALKNSEGRYHLENLSAAEKAMLAGARVQTIVNQIKPKNITELNQKNIKNLFQAFDENFNLKKEL